MLSVVVSCYRQLRARLSARSARTSKVLADHSKTIVSSPSMAPVRSGVTRMPAGTAPARKVASSAGPWAGAPHPFHRLKFERRTASRRDHYPRREMRRPTRVHSRPPAATADPSLHVSLCCRSDRTVRRQRGSQRLAILSFVCSRFLSPLGQTCAHSGSKLSTGRPTEQLTALAAVIFTRRGQRPNASSAKEGQHAERRC
jgi:hypothetical protein